MKEKIIPVIAVVAFVIGIWGLFLPLMPDYVPAPSSVVDSVKQTFGAIGGMLAEQYIPYVKYNGGYKTELSLSVGSTTPKEIINISGGKCNLTTGQSGLTNSTEAFPATTTKMHFCAATGVRVGDQIWVTLPSGIEGGASSSPLTGLKSQGALIVAGATATTSDIIGVALTNLTGAATGSYTQATTGVQYLIFR